MRNEHLEHVQLLIISVDHGGIVSAKTTIRNRSARLRRCVNGEVLEAGAPIDPDAANQPGVANGSHPPGFS
jgi:hypothetical protein